MTTAQVDRAVVILDAALADIDAAKGEVSASTWGSLLAVRDLLTGDPDA